MQSACLLCSNGCGMDIAVKDGRMVGVRGRATDVVNHGRLGPKGLYGSTAWASAGDRLTRPLVREGGATGRDRLGDRDGPCRRALAGAAGGEGSAEPRVLHHRAAVPRGVLHARGDREGRARHPAHGRQHPAVHGDQLPRRSRSRSVRTGSPARTPTSSTATRSSSTATTWPRRRRCCGCGSSTAPAVTTRRASSASTRDARSWRWRPSAPAGCTSRPGSGPTWR